MNKARILLAGICILAAAGGALAFKARSTVGAIWNGVTYVPATTQDVCTSTSSTCFYELPNGQLTTFYTYNGSTYITARHERP